MWRVWISICSLNDLDREDEVTFFLIEIILGEQSYSICEKHKLHFVNLNYDKETKVVQWR